MLFEKSADTKIIEEILSRVEVGQTITYDELSKAIGRDVREFAQASLGSARRGLLRDKQIVFGTEPKVGLVRLDDAGIVRSNERDRQHIHRTAKRSIRKLNCADYSKLSPEDKRQHVAASAQLGAIAMFAHKTSQNKILSNVKADSSQLAIGETLKMFGVKE